MWKQPLSLIDNVVKYLVDKNRSGLDNMSSRYVEIPEFKHPIKFRTIQNDGLTVVYPHFHKEIELIYAVHGSVRIGVNNDRVDLAEGDIMFFASGESHYFLASPDSERLVYQFDLQVFDEAVLREGEKTLMQLFETGQPHSRHWPKTLADSTRDLLVELYQIDQERPIGVNYLILAKLHQMIGSFFQELPERELSEHTLDFSAIQYKDTLERLNKVFVYIESSYQESITIEDIAKVVGFSPYYFSRFFKKNTGQTFGQFLSEYRINEAKFILANEKLPMVEVAEKSGFSSVKTFHHVFKEAVGQSPFQYQKAFNS